MTPRRAFDLEGSEIALVQNRLNVATIALTGLVFSGSFTLALSASLHRGEPTDFRLEFLHILTALVLGITASLASIACFLQSQQSRRAEHNDPASDSPASSNHAARWYSTSQWWFSLGQVFLYMSLSQALSASLTEVVFGVSLTAKTLGAVLGALACIVWWTFLFAGPIAFLRRMSPYQSAAERRALQIAYVFSVLLILTATGAAYNARGGGGLIRNTFQQLYQPLAWHTSWSD